MKKLFLTALVLTAALALGTLPAGGGVVLVEPGHTLNQLVDSAAPLHPSQTALNIGCQIPSSVESIGIDASSGVLYVQLSPGGFTSLSSCIASVTPTVPGVVAIVNPHTLFGINERGTDLHLDPGTGLLLTQDQNFVPGGRIATVNPVGGMVGTYAPVGGLFSGATFGMQISAGLGGSVVPAGDVLFTADVGGNGIHSTPMGGPVTTHVVPPVAGDDIVIQPGGNWVHVADFTGVITSYLPMPPHTATPSPTGLNIQGIFTGAGLPFVFGSRATACDATGDLYISYSGGSGGSGIFRVDAALSTATHVATITSPDGLHDLTVGPSTSGAGDSLYFTVHDGATSGEEVWELTVPECVCDAAPLTQGYWHRQCLGAGLITPGRNGRGPQEPLEPDFVKTLVPAVNALLEQKVFVFRTCEDGMDAVPPSDPCERALKQYTALLLNLTSGRLSLGCEVDLSSLGCTSSTVGGLVDELAALINAGDEASCKRAADCAGAVNENQGIVLSASGATALFSSSSSSSTSVSDAQAGEPAAPSQQEQVVQPEVTAFEAGSTTPRYGGFVGTYPAPAKVSDATEPQATPRSLNVLVAGAEEATRPGEASGAAGEVDARKGIERHLAVLAAASASEERKAAEEALLTAISGGYELELRLRIVRELVGKVDVGLHALLARHLEDIRIEARDAGKEELAGEAETLLRKLEAPSKASAE